MAPTTVALHNGVQMPRLGLGVFKAGPDEGTRRAVRAALEIGYRHVDTAAIYRNEVEVGDALRSWLADTGAARSEVFVTTKLWNDDHGYAAARAAFERSRQALGEIDLYLLHWPVQDLRQDSWRALEDIYREGHVRAIGVSNFTIRHLEELLKTAEVVPMVNQVELHPFLPQRELVDYCRAHRIQTCAYSPLTKGRHLDAPELLHTAERLGRSPAQLLIRWSLEAGHVVLPKSSNPTRIEENFDSQRFELDADARASLDRLALRPVRTAWDPTHAP